MPLDNSLCPPDHYLPELKLLHPLGLAANSELRQVDGFEAWRLRKMLDIKHSGMFDYRKNIGQTKEAIGKL